MLRYTVLLYKNREVPGYSVVVLELPGCFSRGHTVEEALGNAKEAIECHLEGLAEDGEELPVEHEPFILASVAVEAPELKKTENMEQACRATFRGHAISASAIKKAARQGFEGRRIPQLNRSRRYYVEVEGIPVPVPVRWVVQEATGIRVFFSSDEAQRVLRGVGFKVKERG